MGCEQEGWTLQFGSHKSTIMLVIYDKLKEQMSKGNEVNQEFWTRYELRYMKDRAYDVVLNYIEQGEENFNKYSYGLLYSMLDLKKENNYSEHNIMQADTISWWKHFLQEVEKSEIVKYKIKSNNIDKKFVPFFKHVFCKYKTPKFFEAVIKDYINNKINF